MVDLSATMFVYQCMHNGMIRLCVLCMCVCVCVCMWCGCMCHLCACVCMYVGMQSVLCVPLHACVCDCGHKTFFGVRGPLTFFEVLLLLPIASSMKSTGT